MMITSLDLSNNVNLEVLYAENLIFLETLNLKNENNAILTVELSCGYEGEPCELTELTCVTVDNAAAATSNRPPYSNWYIAADFIYSEDCSLGVSSFEDQGFYIQQNPVGEKLGLVSKTFSGKTTFKIFNSEGRLLSIQDLLFEEQVSLDVSNLSNGMYFLNLSDENGNVAVKKFIKE
ncbi:T9SS type A sorting domain-containing protein [Aequorivita sp. H23M31]|uniref:T9SS type A sorting domain-containing protein n=2 Tax=Aequorivita ciconiae TaxID=2494375 RepID=A0A410G7M8_9FLAO|nr:T9SS type A sorting domain-containing protein [Aequorivita sp. H23M31]